MALSSEQRQILAAAIRGSSNPTIAALAVSRENDQAITDWCNAASTYVVWKTFVPKAEVGKTFVATAIAAITAGNNDKLSSYAAWNPEGVDPSRKDTRDFFDDIFSVAAGASTRAALLALWKRLVTNAERAFITAPGGGTDQTPGFVIWEGTVSLLEVSQALNDNP
jgi:hypothetical protein